MMLVQASSTASLVLETSRVEKPASSHTFTMKSRTRPSWPSWAGTVSSRVTTRSVVTARTMTYFRS
jgi:hypothetical protein